MADEGKELQRVTPSEGGQLVRPGYPRPAYPAAYGYGYREAEETPHLRELLRIIQKRKWVVIIIVLLTTLIVAAEAYRAKSLYQATTIIQLKKDNATLVKMGDVVVQADDSDAIKTSLLVLRSRALLEDVAFNLHLDQNPKFLGDGKSSEEQSQDKEQVTVIDVASMIGPKPTLTTTEIEHLEPYVDAMQRGLTVEQVGDTTALSIAFTHTDPTIAAFVADGIAQTFIKRSFESDIERYSTTSEWLDRTTRELQAKVQQAEAALVSYMREHNMYATPDARSTLSTDKLSRLHEQATRAEVDRILKQSLYEEVKAGRVAQLPEAFSDPKTAELQKQLNQLELTAAQLDVTHGPKHPEVIKIRQQMATIRQQIANSRSVLEEKLRADYERAVRDEASLKAALEQAKAEAAQQNQAAIQYGILKQNVDTYSELYKDFLQKTGQIQIKEHEQHNGVRIIEPARIPKFPVGPRRLRMVVLAFILSLAAGIGLVFFLEYFDNTIKTVEDVNRYAQLPALGVIPTIGKSGAKKLSIKGRDASGKELVSTQGFEPAQLMAIDGRSTAAEAYRILRTSVLLSSVGGPPKTILVTSGQPGEGKTTTVINTAISFAQLGTSVLIIDGDLRKPSTHKMLGVDAERGLSTYLSSNVEVDDLILKLPISNLSLLPCGPVPPNPAEMISSSRMRDLLAMLAERYDHILIDSPPLAHVTDPVILSTLADGVILVVHGGKSTRDMVRRARQDLLNAGAKIYGVVLNNIDPRRQGYDYYYHYRYYYGHEADDGQAN
jgi:succinoglycan biosynthesis transport protein ExoP